MNYLEIYENNIESLLDVERYKDARRELAKAYKEFPESISLKYLETRIAHSADENTLALELIQSLLQQEPDDPNYRFLHCKILVDLDKEKEAEVIIQDLIKDYPDDAENYGFYALILIDLKKYKKARQLAEQSLKIDPDQILGKIGVAMLNLLSGKLKASDSIIRDLIAKHPDTWAVAWVSGLQLYSKGKYAAALEVFQELLKQTPNDPDLLYMIVEMKILLHPWCRLFIPTIHFGFKATLVATTLLAAITRLLSKYVNETTAQVFAVCGVVWLIMSVLVPSHLKKKLSLS